MICILYKFSACFFIWVFGLDHMIDDVVNEQVAWALAHGFGGAILHTSIKDVWNFESVGQLYVYTFFKYVL